MRLAPWVLVVCTGCDTPASAERTWQHVGDHGTSLLSVWGANEHDVWIVGARTELAASPSVFRYDGDAIAPVDPGLTGVDLWWVFGPPGSDAVFFTGSNGTILRYRDGSFEHQPTPRAGTLFGLWGAAEDDLWAVGDGGSDGAIVLRYDGATWREQPLPPDVPSQVLKVSGTAADDVWISCGRGVVLHWNGSTLERHATGVTAPLFSIAATPTGPVAVGGQVGIGHLLEYGGGVWTDAPLVAPEAWRGVAANAGEVWAVGERGIVARRDGSGWQIVQRDPSELAFHATWIDPRGGVWSVGGDIDRIPRSVDGVVTYYGTAELAGRLP